MIIDLLEDEDLDER